jgi:hypothetical protein
MPINTFGSKLKVETNYGGTMRDNDEVIQEHNHKNHSVPPSSNPWSQNYRGLDPTYQEPAATPVDDDPQLREAVNQDLKQRNLKDHNGHYD